MPNLDARVSLLSSLLLHGVGLLILFQVPVEEVFSAATNPSQNAPLAIQLVGAPLEAREEQQSEPPKKEIVLPEKKATPLRPLPAVVKRPVEKVVKEVRREVKSVRPPVVTPNQAKGVVPPSATSRVPAIESSQESAAREILNYQSMIVAMIAKQKRYPARAERLGLEGVVGLSIAVSREGSLLDCTISKPSKYSFFDEEVLRMARAAAPFPKAPDTIQSSAVRLKIPVQFQLQ